MDFDLNDELLAIQETAREFAEKEVAPTVDEDDRAHRFRKDLVRKMGELGFFGCIIPEKAGGTNTGFVSLVIITEEIARIHSSLRVAINMQIGPARALAEFGSAELQPEVSEEDRGRRIAELLCHHGAGHRLRRRFDADARRPRRRRLRPERQQDVDFERPGG